MKDNEDTHVNMNGDDETPEDEDRLILSEEDVKDLILREYNIVEKKFLELYNNPDMSFSEVIGSAHTIFSGLEEIDELLESGNLDSQQAKDLKNLTSERKESGFAEVYDILFEHLILDDLYIYHSALDSALGNLFPLNIINDSLPERKKDSFSQTYFDEPKLVEQIKDLDLGRMIDVYFVINDVLFKGPEQPCFGEFYKDLVLKNKDKKSYLPRASGEVSFEYLPAILDDDCLKEFFESVIQPENPYIYKHILSQSLRFINTKFTSKFFNFIPEDPNKFKEDDFKGADRVYFFSSVAVYSLLRKVSEENEKKLPVVSSDLVKAFFQEGNRKDSYKGLFSDFLLYDNPYLLFLADSLTQTISRELKLNYDAMDYFALLAADSIFSLLHRQAESDELNDLFDI